MEAAGVPGALLPLVILLEAGGGLSPAARSLHPLAGACLCRLLCARRRLLFHLHPDDQMQMISFMKNITIAGGFLVLAGAGAGALALDNRR